MRSTLACSQGARGSPKWPNIEFCTKPAHPQRVRVYFPHHVLRCAIILRLHLLLLPHGPPCVDSNLSTAFMTSCLCPNDAVYSNSLLATLNARNRLRGGSAHDVSVSLRDMQPSTTVRAPIPPQPSSGSRPVCSAVPKASRSGLRPSRRRTRGPRPTATPM